MDGVSSIPRDTFYAILERTLRRPGVAPFSLLPWPPSVSLALFVHRIDGLFPGLYLLARDNRHLEELREFLDVELQMSRAPEPRETPALRKESKSMGVSCREAGAMLPLEPPDWTSLRALPSFMPLA